MSTALLALLVSSAWAEAPKMTIQSATAREVKITWTGGQTKTFVVERKPLNGGYSDLMVVEGRETVDRAFSPYETYTYRVREKETEEQVKAKQRNPSSNDWKIGPPPQGFNQIAESPKGAASRLGLFVNQALDSNGDPMLAWLFFDVDGDQDPKDSMVQFRNWDRLTMKWLPIQTIDTVSGETENPGDHQVSIALDRVTGRIGIAYVRQQGDDTDLWIATSNDGGRSFAKRLLYKNPGHSATQPRLTLYGGNGYCAFIDTEGTSFLTFNGDEPAKAVRLPNTPGTEPTYLFRPAIALDSEGKPGVLYWLNAKDREYTTVLAYWRPGNDPIEVVDSNKVQSDACNADLVYFWTRPMVAVQIMRVLDDFDNTLWFLSSNEGRQWSKPVNVPRDGDLSWGSPISVSVDSQGRAAVSATTFAGKGGNKHGLPKVSRGAGGSFTTTSSDVGNTMNLTGVYTPQLIYSWNDKLYVSYRLTQDDNPKQKPGIWLWRE